MQIMSILVKSTNTTALVDDVTVYMHDKCEKVVSLAVL